MNIHRISLFFFVLCIILPLKGLAFQDVDGSGANRLDTLYSTQDNRLLRVRSAVESMFHDEDKNFNRADSVIRELDRYPPFGIFRDNYFVLGTSLTGSPKADNSNVKFQISISHRLTSSLLPFRTYLFLTYTQLAIWDVFQDSFPFRDINYNPGIGLGRALIKDNRYLGGVLLQFEHESNGKDGLASRSWNKISIGSNIIFNRYWSASGKLWIPFVDGENNPDLTRYVGWSKWGTEYRDKRAKYIVSAVVSPRRNFSANLHINFAMKINQMANQYLYIDFYNGYGENMLDYNSYRRQLRIGFVIKSHQGIIF